MSERTKTGANELLEALGAGVHNVIPLEPFAEELIRLAKTVDRHVRTGVAPVQTVSQLIAMEQLVKMLRSVGMQLIRKGDNETDDSATPGYV